MRMRRSSSLSHLGADGRARMVDVSGKAATTREAVASAAVRMKSDVLDQVVGGKLAKGDALSAARIAGVMAAKRTGELIPLCHPLSLEWVDVELTRTSRSELRVVCTARTTARTGVEMEAMTGAAVAALTLYDMAKSADKSITIGPIQLERKTGGKSGTYERTRRAPPKRTRAKR